eukprot:TRINITY_DN68466_c0_g1_i1.p1 TRINITY_DN68466_c0_g1~~TRINITY_DN68466_c0_g1_i1.p1  ORF type:complete len:405 (-),score=64.45 TRINITY_DN68466_c0_g1_i1:101-1270(-)
MPTSTSMKAIQEERRALEELACVNQMTIRKQGEMERDARAALPEETLDTIIRLENTLKVEKQNTEKLLKENKLLETQLHRKEKEFAKYQGELEDVKRETGWVKGVSVRREEKDAKNQENKIAELQLQLQKLEEEQRTNKQIQKRKTQLIENLSKELDNKKQLEEELYQAHNTVKVKEREIKDYEEELKTLKRIHLKKDKLIVSMENEKDDNHLKQLEGDKRFLQAEIAKHNETNRQQGRTLKAQQVRIEQLMLRLDGITQALRELRSDGGSPIGDDSSMEAVDVEEYEQLQRDLDSLRNQLNLKEVIIQEKDTNIETLERKVEILAHAKRSEARAIQAERREKEYQIDDLRRTLDSEQEKFRKESDRLKQENARLRKQMVGRGGSPLLN